jgi:hypothetical protein
VERNDILQVMRKRRVGVTASSREIVGSWKSSPQIGSEIAAPLELRTPVGTVATATKMSADGSMVTRARKTDSGREFQKGSGETREGWDEESGTSAPGGAHEALPHTSPGGKPPETPAPFPSESIFQIGRNQSRVRKPRQKRAPLTDSFRSENSTRVRERGPSGRRPLFASRWSARGMSNGRGQQPSGSWGRVQTVGAGLNSLRQQGKILLKTC